MNISELDAIREEYEAAQDVVESKREAFHAAIRKLYMSGVSLREIADHLSVSHQRIHKIVGLEPPKRKRGRAEIIASLFVVFLLSGLGVLLMAAGVLAGPNLLYEHVSFEVYETRMVESLSKRLDSDPRVKIWWFSANSPPSPESFKPMPGFQELPLRSEISPGGEFTIRPKSVVAGFEINRDYGSLTGVGNLSHPESQLTSGRAASWVAALLAFAASILLVRKLRQT